MLDDCINHAYKDADICDTLANVLNAYNQEDIILIERKLLFEIYKVLKEKENNK